MHRVNSGARPIIIPAAIDPRPPSAEIIARVLAQRLRLSHRHARVVVQLAGLDREVRK